MKTEFTDKELLERRLAGILPTINIAGQDFIIDLRFQELRAVNDFSTRIKLDGLPLMPDAKNYYCYYNTVLRQAVNVFPNSTRLPKDTVMLVFPEDKGLDPVGAARKYGVPDDALLYRFPIQRNMTAQVIPLNKPPFAQTVKQNRQQRPGKNWLGKLLKRTKSKGKGL